MLRSIPFLALLGALASCSVGSLPTQDGKVPSLDGSNLTNVNATSLGGVAAKDVSNGLQTINAATDNSTPSTLVQRDASGNFSAGTITASLSGNATTSTFSLGKAGSPVASAAIVSFDLTQGNFFNITGITNISAFGAQPAGTRVTVYFTGALTLVHNATTSPKLILAGGGSFTTAAGDFFEFISLGGGDWQEASRTVSNDSYVSAFLTDGQSLPIGGNDITLLYNDVVTDSQGEYNPSTGIFTATQAGAYQISAGFMAIQSVGWGSGDSCEVQVGNRTAGGEAPTARAIVSSATGAGTQVATNVSLTMLASAGDKFSVEGACAASSGTTTLINTDPRFNFLSITRLH